MISFNLSSGHCKLLQRVWKELRNDKLKQVERPVLWSISQSPEQLSNAPSTSLGLVCTWNDPVQQQLYHIVLSFVDNAVSELRSRRFRADLHRHCRRFGRQMAAVFRGAVDVDQALSWEMLGQSVMENLHAPFRSNAAKLFIWQLFLEHLSSMVLEAFCWSVARDFTSRPLPTIYESDPKDCFLQAKNAPPKPTVLQRILSKLVRRQLHLSDLLRKLQILHNSQASESFANCRVLGSQVRLRESEPIMPSKCKHGSSDGWHTACPGLLTSYRGTQKR